MALWPRRRGTEPSIYMPIHDLVERLSATRGKTVVEDEMTGGTGVAKALDDICTEAMRGTLTIWHVDESRQWREKIPPSYWADHAIDYLNFIGLPILRDKGRGYTRRVIGEMDLGELYNGGVRGDERAFTDLWVSAAEAEKVFYPPQPKTVWSRFWSWLNGS